MEDIPTNKPTYQVLRTPNKIKINKQQQKQPTTTNEK